ncbi:MAG TPA: hypothetical protein VLX92_00475 [Kofleriaceae bacterium]|nr:hypothetical protein [Kofleriaceae bacterium]
MRGAPRSRAIGWRACAMPDTVRATIPSLLYRDPINGFYHVVTVTGVPWCDTESPPDCVAGELDFSPMGLTATTTAPTRPPSTAS